MNRKKTIVFSIGSLTKGGAERVIVNLAEHFYKEGYQTYIVTKMIAKDEYPLSEGITRIVADITEEETTKSRAKNLYLRIKKMRDVWKKIQPNIIVSFIGKNNFMTIVSSRGLKIPVVVSVRSNPRREYGNSIQWFLAQFLFPKADGIILQTKDAKEAFGKKVQEKAVILPNPMNALFVRDLYLGERQKEIVTVGRIDSNKNQELLIDAFSEIAKEFPEWKCKLYGDGEKRFALEKKVAEKGLENQILFMGRQSDIPDKIGQVAIFVLPSKVEGMPNALIEAMALGLAVISTNCPCGGPRELITEGVNGLLIQVDDKDALKNALVTLMNQKKLRETLGSKAFESSKAYYPDKVLKVWQEYLENLMIKEK